MTNAQIALIVFVALIAADVWTTYLFPRYGIREANKWLDRLMGRYGFDELVLVKYVVFVGIMIATHQGVVPVWLLAAACAGQAGVVVWNLYVINKRRKERNSV